MPGMFKSLMQTVFVYIQICIQPPVYFKSSGNYLVYACDVNNSSRLLGTIITKRSIFNVDKKNF